MKIEKYIFNFPKANRWAAAKYKLPALSPTQLQVIYSVKRLGTATNASIIQYLRKQQNTANDNAVSYALRDLTLAGMLLKTNRVYNLSPTGREYISLVRSYLLNIRL